MYEWEIAERAVSTKPARILTLKPSKFQPSKISRLLSLNQMIDRHAVIGVGPQSSGLGTVFVTLSRGAPSLTPCSSYWSTSIHRPTMPSLVGHTTTARRLPLLAISTASTT